MLAMFILVALLFESVRLAIMGSDGILGGRGFSKHMKPLSSQRFRTESSG